MQKLLSGAALLALVLCFSNCKVTRPTPYLQGIQDSLAKTVTAPDMTIRPDDVLAIQVYSDNPTATAIFNQQSGGASVNTEIQPGATVVPSLSGSGSMPEYRVDKHGDIQMYAIGKVHVEGLTTDQVHDVLRDKLANYLNHPYFTVRLKNFKVTFLGEVSKPGIIAVNDDHINILEALSLAGDITLYGMKEDITVIRQVDGKREYGRLDVSRASVTYSPYFYLQQNDIVIVGANPKKPGVTEQENSRKLTMVATAATIVTAIAVLINLFR